MDARYHLWMVKLALATLFLAGWWQDGHFSPWKPWRFHNGSMNHGYINEQDGILWWFNGILYGVFLIGSNDCSKNDDLGNNIPLWEMGLHTSVQMVSLIEASVVEPISFSGWCPILSIQNPKILHQESKKGISNPVLVESGSTSTNAEIQSMSLVT